MTSERIERMDEQYVAETSEYLIWISIIQTYSIYE